MATREEMAVIGARLREARLRAGATQAEAGAAAGVERSTVSNWEAGRNLPGLLQFRALLTLYAASSYLILFGENRFSMTRAEAGELSQALGGFSKKLRSRMEMLLLIAAEDEAEQARPPPR